MGMGRVRVTPDPAGSRAAPACEERGHSLVLLWGLVCFSAFFIDLGFDLGFN